MARDKLAETLDMKPIEEEIKNIEIPEDADLETIARLTLELYKDLINDTIFAEQLEKLASIEVAIQALKLSQEAMIKLEELRLKERKMALDEYKEISKKDENAKLSDTETNRRLILDRLKEELEGEG